MAETLLNSMSRDQQEWENQIGYERFVRDCISRENNAYRKGEKEGIQQGISQKAIEAAGNFLKEGIAPEIVARCTGLPLEQVLQIKENLSVNA
ncbi:MAG: hypothetical protein J5857_08625 [Treponema sp.]|nr:hypothetical protein [Treponema sp.]